MRRVTVTGVEDAQADRAEAERARRERARDDAVELLGLLAEPERLAVVAAVVLGADTIADAARVAGVAPRAAYRALRRLEGGGLVLLDESGAVLFEPQRLKDVVRAATPPEPVEDLGPVAPAEAAVLRAFLSGGRLTGIPAARAKRLVVLDHVARVFEPGVRYPEREVNALLRAFHPDVAALRRYLVDEELLSRESGEYWRTGGTVDV